MTCKECDYCKCVGRTNGLYSGRGESRKEYMCKHPNANNLFDKNGFKVYPFVGYGDCTNKSPLQLKTHKRWCPLAEKALRERENK